MRDVLTANPSWALPIRGVVGARPVKSRVLLDVAWLNNDAELLARSPLLLLRLTDVNVGARICPPGAEAAYDCIDSWPRALWPSPIRHCGHAAAALPLLAVPASFNKTIASLRVCFMAVASHDEIIAAVEVASRPYGGTVVWVKHRWFLLGSHSATATFSLAAAAFGSLRGAHALILTANGARISAAFV
jgi:hypothetical protein